MAAIDVLTRLWELALLGATELRLRLVYSPDENDGIWNIVYYDTLLGKIDERTWKITGVQEV